MKTSYVVVAAIAFAFAFGCGKDSAKQPEERASSRAQGCQVSGSCKACLQSTDCPSGEICTTFPIGDRRYSGCVQEHGCGAPEILSQAAEKCGTANPVTPEAAPAGSAAPAPAPAGSATPKK